MPRWPLEARSRGYNSRLPAAGRIQRPSNAHGRDDQAPDRSQRAESIRDRPRGPAAQLFDAADVPLDLASARVFSRRGEGLGEVSVLRIRVPAEALTRARVPGRRSCDAWSPGGALAVRLLRL